MALEPLYLIDASIYIFRSYFGMPQSITNAGGAPANAVHGYASFLGQLLCKAQPRFIAAAFDESLDQCFRNELYPDYKANRSLPEPELATQLQWCRDLTELLGIKTYASERFEADDLIGTLARRMRGHRFRMVYVTGDKDLGQLLVEQDRLWDFANDTWLAHDGIRQRYGVAPHQLVDYLALAGDAIDNIPGVPGIGARTAAALLQEFESLDELYGYLRTRDLRQRDGFHLRGVDRTENLLRAHEEQARTSKVLATIADNAPIRPQPQSLRRKPVSERKLLAWLDENGFGTRLRSQLLKL
jgi:DNA polymerase-1